MDDRRNGKEARTFRRSDAIESPFVSQRPRRAATAALPRMVLLTPAFICRSLGQSCRFLFVCLRRSCHPFLKRIGRPARQPLSPSGLWQIEVANKQTLVS